MKLVLIEWIDAHGPKVKSWRSLEDIRHDNRRLLIRSVGWLVASDKETLTILPHIYSEESGAEIHGQGELVIPRRSIRKEVVLRKNG